MRTKHLDAITRSLSSLPSRRDVMRGFTSTGLVLAAVGLSDAAEARKKGKKHRHKPKQKPLPPSPPSPPPSPPPFNAFGCLDVGQPCQADSTLCCSGICDPGSSTCVAHNSGVCFSDTDPCISGRGFPCNPNNSHCACAVTTGNAGFCADLTDVSDPIDLCRFCSTDTECEEEFGPGAACVVLRGFCSAACAATGRTACMRPCA
jgi:hypothetical protein